MVGPWMLYAQRIAEHIRHAFMVGPWMLHGTGNSFITRQTMNVILKTLHRTYPHTLHRMLTPKQWPLRGMFVWLRAAVIQPCVSFSRPSFSLQTRLAGRGQGSWFRLNAPKRIHILDPLTVANTLSEHELEMNRRLVA